MVTTSESDFLSIKEFAGKIGAHSNTIRRGIKKGRISACNIGTGKKKIYRIPRTEIERIALFNLNDIVDDMVAKKMQSLSIANKS